MIAALRGLVFLSSFIRLVYIEGALSITFSKNPVYRGEWVTLTCTNGDIAGVIVSLTLDAFNETQKVGTLFCNPSSGFLFRNIGTGRFAGYSYTGCDTISVKAPSASVVIEASPSWELDYICTFEVFVSPTVRNVSSASTRLSVWVMPSAPSLYPRPLVFNETDNLTLECSSLLGKPAASIYFFVVQPLRQSSQQVRGNGSVSLELHGLAKDWHKGEVTCRVENHDFPNMTARGMIHVNHIAAFRDSSLTVNAHSSNLTLDCSAYITSFPGVTFLWSVPPNANVSQLASPSTPVFTLLQGQTGLFNCTATNNLTGKAEVITFNVISEASSLSTWIIVIAVVVPAFIIIIIVILVVLYKHGCFSKVINGDDCSSTHANNSRIRVDNRDRQEMRDSKSPSRSRVSYPEGGCGRDDDGVVKESLIRGAQPTDDVECSERARPKPLLKASVTDRRLLIAAEGVVANLKHKTLPTTVLVNYPDHSCSLDGILVQVGQAISLPAPPSFKSVALLLRRLKVGLSLSEVDRAVLTSRCVTGENGGKLRDFLARLANMSLNKSAGDTRIDVLNYDGRDAAQLAKALEDLLKVSVTVSSDPFGFGETNSPHSAKQYAVGADYFNRRSVDEVVYADVGVADGPLRSQPIKDGDQVLYSEIARNV